MLRFRLQGEGSADYPLDMLLLITSDHAIQIVQWDPRSATFGALSTVQAAAPNASPGSPPALPCMAGSILSDQHEMVCGIPDAPHSQSLHSNTAL